MVASLPMRNWNGIISSNLPEFFLCCEPTYEELKLFSVSEYFLNPCRLRAYLWGIETSFHEKRKNFQRQSCEPTYEELKLGDNRGVNPRRWGRCEPTYEELKPFSQSFQASFFSSVASLPMRNWNFIEYMRARIFCP